MKILVRTTRAEMKMMKQHWGKDACDYCGKMVRWLEQFLGSFHEDKVIDAQGGLGNHEICVYLTSLLEEWNKRLTMEKKNSLQQLSCNEDLAGGVSSQEGLAPVAPVGRPSARKAKRPSAVKKRNCCCQEGLAPVDSQ